jgi:YidC/Oxa1 family membrane protein insertase
VLEKKYKGNKQKYTEEVQKLYKEEGVSMLGGCLPTILMLVMVFGLYGVVYRPVRYLMDQNKEASGVIAQKLIEMYDAGTYVDETGKGEVWISNLKKQAESGKLNEINVAQALKGNTQALSAEYPGLFEIDFMFFGLDLGDMPSYNPMNTLVILPILSAVSAFGMSWLTQKFGRITGSAAAESAAKSANTMMYIMPIMSLFIGFALPAGVTLYWIVNNILSGAQEPLLVKIANKRYGKALPAAEEK